MSQLLTAFKDCRYRLILQMEKSDNRPIDSFRSYTSHAAQKLAIILHQIFKKPRKDQMNSIRRLEHDYYLRSLFAAVALRQETV